MLVLIAVGMVSVLAWQIPNGSLVLYPFTLLATWFHEMGHGLAAIAAGGSFVRLDLFPDGSGLARYTLPADAAGGLRQALIAAGGPFGPALAGAFLIRLSPHVRASRVVLGVLAVVMLASVALWIRAPFGMAMIGTIGAVLVVVAVKASDRVAHFVVNLLGVQAIISTFRQVDYLFTESIEIDGQHMLSDTGRMADVLTMPHWAWAVWIIAVSAVLLAWSLRAAYRSRPS